MEPWNLNTETERPADTLTNVVIFCEDDGVEPAYFDSFRTSNLKVTANGNYGQHHKHVDAVCEHFRDQNLLESLEGRESLKVDEGTYVWCVFDRDKNPSMKDGKDTAFNDSISNAEGKGIKVAWSNDDFELWLLLHFEDVPNDDSVFTTAQLTMIA